MQRLRTAVKRITAIGAGFAMAGASMMGALAAQDLGMYPSPFVDKGKFDPSTAIVVGEKAAASDTLGAVDIARQLQFDSKVCVPSKGASGGVSVSGDAYEIGSASDLLEIGETVGSVRETVTETELDGLKGGIVTTNEGTTEFNQYLRFSTLSSTGAQTLNSPIVNFTKNDGPSDDVGDWLVVSEGTNASSAFFEYQLEFEDGLESDVVSSKLDDLEDEEVIMLGTTYTFVDTSIDTVKDEVTLELLGGSIYDILEEGEEKTYTLNGKEYKVEVMIVEDTTPATVTFNVNGEVTDQLVDGETEILKDGTLMGISDIILNEAGESGLGDIVELYLGATKLELKDANYSDSESSGGTSKNMGFEQGVEIDEETIEDAFVQIKGTELSSGAKFEVITLKYRLNADALPGYRDLYIPPGKGVREYLDEPQGLLGTDWDIRYEGLDDVGVSMIKIDPQGDDEYTLEFENINGVIYKVPYITFEGGSFKYGDNNDDLVFIEGNYSESVVLNGLNITSNYAIGGEPFNIGLRDYFVLTDTSKNTGAGQEDLSLGYDNTGITHVVRYNAVDTSDRTLSFDDVATGTKEFTYEPIAATNSATLGKADLVFSGNTFIAYVGNVTQNGGDNPLAIDMDADGDIGRAEVRVVVNGGGIIDLGFSNRSDGGNWSISNNFVASNVTWSNTGRLIPSDWQSSVFNITTLSEDFDENKPTTETRAGSFNEQIAFNITTRANNELGIPKVGALLPLNEPDDDDDNSYGMSAYGVHVNLFDPSGSSEAETLTIQYPLTQRGGRVFVSMGDTQTTKTSTGEVCTVANIQLNNVLDSEVRDPTQHNLIVVGGPCANSVASDLFVACPDWTNKAGEGLIQLIENGENVAMLVAGTEASDTRLAAKVIANYGDYATDLAGKDKVMVSGSSVSDVKLA